MISSLVSRLAVVTLNSIDATFIPGIVTKIFQAVICDVHACIDYYFLVRNDKFASVFTPLSFFETLASLAGFIFYKISTVQNLHLSQQYISMKTSTLLQP